LKYDKKDRFRFSINVGKFSFAQDFSLFKKFRFSQGEQTLPYRVLLPEKFDRGKISVGYFSAWERGKWE
jgi:hypothetical protein